MAAIQVFYIFRPVSIQDLDLLLNPCSVLVQMQVGAARSRRYSLVFLSQAGFLPTLKPCSSATWLSFLVSEGIESTAPGPAASMFFSLRPLG